MIKLPVLDIGDSKSYPIKLLGTLDENRIGHKDDGRYSFRCQMKGDHNGTSIRAYPQQKKCADI